MSRSTRVVKENRRTGAQSTTIGPQCGNETDYKRLKEICESTTTPFSNRLAAMEGAIPRMSTIIEDILARLAQMEAPEPQPPPPQETPTESFNTLRDDENTLLEEKSTLLPQETTSPNPFHTGESDH